MDLENIDGGQGANLGGLLGSLDFSVSSLIAGFVFGVLGIYLFRHGKKKSNFWLVFIGIFLMVYPYFVSRPWLTWGLGFAALWLAYEKRYS